MPELKSCFEIDFGLTDNGSHAYLGSVRVDQYDRLKTLHIYVPATTSTERLSEILAVVERSNTRLPNSKIMELLGKLAVLCRTRAMDENEQLLSIVAFAERLKDYPADAVARSLECWPEDHTFQPSWFELKTDILLTCWTRVRLRNNLRALVKHREKESQ